MAGQRLHLLLPTGVFVPVPTHPLTISRAVVDCFALSAVHRAKFVADVAARLLVRTIFVLTLLQCRIRSTAYQAPPIRLHRKCMRQFRSLGHFVTLTGVFDLDPLRATPRSVPLHTGLRTIFYL